MRRGGRARHPSPVVTRNEPDTLERDQNQPVSVRTSAYTESMKTAEIRGISPLLRKAEKPKSPIIVLGSSPGTPAVTGAGFRDETAQCPSLRAGLKPLFD
jgi:hypothetical protein